MSQVYVDDGYKRGNGRETKLTKNSLYIEKIFWYSIIVIPSFIKLVKREPTKLTDMNSVLYPCSDEHYFIGL